MPLQAFIVNPASGKLDMSSAPSLVAPGDFVIAENIEYDISGSKKKRLGTTRYNATVISGATQVTALSDYWRHALTLSGTQKFVAHAGTVIYKDDGDGVWDSLKTTWGAAAKDQNICIAQGYAVISTSNNDTPQIYDQTNIADLNAGALPKFTAATYHLRRLFTVGETAALSGAVNPSRSTFSAAGDITLFTGSDTGNLIFDDDDGDFLVGVSQPLRGRLYFFKGPFRGSIHVVGGRSPTTFEKAPVCRGIPCVSHKSIITTANDVYWVSPYGIHSLVMTEKYGDTQEVFLSRAVQSLFNRVNFARVGQIAGFHAPHRNIIGWSLPIGTSTTNDTTLVYNYAREAWAVWTHTGLDAASFMTARNPLAGTSNLKPSLYIGSYAGFVYNAEQTVLADDDATRSYTSRLRSPAHYRLDRVPELQEKVFHSVCSFIKPAAATAQLQTNIDNRSASYTIDLAAGSGADLIGSTFVIGTSLIGSGLETSYIETPIEDRGRGIQLEWSLGGTNQNLELYGYGIRYTPTEPTAMERS